MRVAGAGDELLLSVEHVMLAIARGAGAQRRGVRAGAGLGQAIARQPLHVDEPGQVFLALRLVAEPSIIQAHMLWIEMIGGDRGAAGDERLEDQRRVEPCHPRAADILAHVDAAMPSAAASRITSTGKCFFSSHSSACGASCSSAKRAPCRGSPRDRRPAQIPA